jgi:hypothetical protein
VKPRYHTTLVQVSHILEAFCERPSPVFFCRSVALDTVTLLGIARGIEAYPA